MVKGKMEVHFYDKLGNRKTKLIICWKGQQNWQPSSNYLTKEKIKFKIIISELEVITRDED